MVHSPTERIAAHFSEKKKNKSKRGKNDIMRPEGPMLSGQHLLTGYIVSLETFCLSCGASRPLRKTFACPAAHLGDDTMVQGPTERTAVHFSGKGKAKTGAKIIL